MAEFEKAAVKPFYEDAPLDIDFQKRLKSVVVTDLNMLEKICNQENKIVAFDTETTGLVYYKDHIVGCSMSFNGESGFYVPLRHEQPDGTPATFNLPIKESLHLIYEKLLKRNQVILYNSCFDLTMIGQELDKIGVDFTDIENVKFLDAQCLVYFLEPEIKKNGLKWAARHFLGRISPEFLQVLGVTKKSIKTKGKHFGHINPWQEVTIEPQFIELKGAKKKLTEADVLHNSDMLEIGTYTTTGAIYGINDSANTYALYEKLCPVVQDMQMQHNKTTLDPFAFVTDSRLAKAMLHYKHTPISIDSKLMGNFLEDVENQIEETETKIFEIAGKPFNISSTPQKREIFQSLGINTGVETKTGMSVSVSALANVNHPIVDLLTKRSHLEKRRSAYFEPLSKEQISRINYKTCAVATGRLASGKGNEIENTYFSSISVQTLPKSKMCLYEAVYVGEDNSDPENILGYKFHPVTPTYAEGNPDKIYVEGFSQELNVRNSLCAPHHIYVETPTEKLDFGFDIIKAENYIRANNLEPERLICEKSNDWYVCSLDISAEELAIIANLSKEPNFIEPLLKREDLHRCYSDDTEFLTENGFKKFDDIAPNEKIAQYHPDGTIDYVLPTDRHESYAEEMIEIKNNYIDLKVTPNHRMLYRTSKINPYRVKEMKDLLGKNFLMQTTARDLTGEDRIEAFKFPSTEIKGREYNKNLSFDPDLFIEFLGFFLGDGHVSIATCDKGNSYRVHISQSTKEQKHSKYLLDLNTRMGDFFAVYTDTKNNVVRLERNHIALCKWLLENTKDAEGNRCIPRWIFGLSHRQRELFLQAFIKAQGHSSKRPNRNFSMIYAETEGLFQDLLRLSFLQGYHTHKYPSHATIKGYMFGIHLRDFDGVKKEHIKKISEKCRVVCFSVPSSFLVVKRNNRICISGNSMAQKMFPEFATADKATQKNLRKKAKSGNFGLAYRGSHLALRDIDSEEEQLRVYNAWWSNMPIYRQWQQERINEMMMFTEGDAINHYGRKRRFKHLLTTGRQGDTNSAIRAACNHYVQGLGADYIRICMSRFYDEILKENKNFNEIRFVASIHDELAFAIRKDVLDKWLFKVMTIMETSYPQEFIVPFISNAQIGPTFGFGFDFDYDRDPKTFKLIEGSKLRLRV